MEQVSRRLRVHTCPNPDLPSLPGADLPAWRAWLVRQLDAASLAYARQDNWFPWIADWATARRLMDRQLKVNWLRLLEAIARQLNPLHGELFQQHPIAYYWSTHQSERALDLVFRDPAGLRRGRRVRALPPVGDDRPLFEGVSRGEFMLNGFGYHLTASGRKAITAILTTLRSTVRQRTSMVA